MVVFLSHNCHRKCAFAVATSQLRRNAWYRVVGQCASPIRTTVQRLHRPGSGRSHRTGSANRSEIRPYFRFQRRIVWPCNVQIHCYLHRFEAGNTLARRVAVSISACHVILDLMKDSASNERNKHPRARRSPMHPLVKVDSCSVILRLPQTQAKDSKEGKP